MVAFADPVHHPHQALGIPPHGRALRGDDDRIDVPPAAKGIHAAIVGDRVEIAADQAAAVQAEDQREIGPCRIGRRQVQQEIIAVLDRIAVLQELLLPCRGRLRRGGKGQQQRRQEREPFTHLHQREGQR